MQYNWELDEPSYIALLRAFDLRRDATDLTAFVDVERIEDAEE
jgi:hypothetical protein